VTQQNENQFDDDLTVGMESDGSFPTDSIDLFEFTGDEESPIARLKSIILSIDWEINDDILQQLDDELVDLGDIWAGDKIKQVYIQGLSKIGKYIYKEKANAHPNSIKLLITFYHNLEKIVSSGDLMSEEEKKQVLLEDVKKFDQLKSQIGKSDSASGAVGKGATSIAVADTADDEEHLKVLKAHILAIDWEINDIELQMLSDEVQRLQGVFSQSKAKLILLQGIGALSSYINKMRSNANGKAFTLLHSFYGVLEKISVSELSEGQEKHLLLSEVEKFTAFKEEIAQTQSELQVKSEVTPPVEFADPAPDVVPEVPVESLPVDESDDEIQVAFDVESRLTSVFGEVEEPEVEGIADDGVALEGVNVETEADDDSDEEALPYEDGSVAPALAEVEEESSFSVEKLAGDLAESTDAEVADDAETVYESVPQGVDVETEADDDSDEEALPFQDGEIAPALTGSTDEGGFDEDSLMIADSEDLDNRLGFFFDDEVQTSSDEWSDDQQGESEQKAEDDGQDIVAALSDVTDEEQKPAEEDLASAADLDFLDQDVPAPPLIENEELSVAEEVIEETVEERLSFFDEEVPAPELDDVVESFVEDDVTEEDTAEDQLSFLDEDIPAPGSAEPEGAFFDDGESGRVEEIFSLTDDAPAPALSDVTEPVSDDDSDERDAIEGAFFEETERLAVLDDEEAAVADSGDEEVLSFFAEEPVDSDESEELFDTDEIEFTVPGEVTSEIDSDIIDDKESSLDDVIDFKVPGEEDASEIIFAATEETDPAEVVFEAVNDDVEVDPLPGEEYADSVDAVQVDDEEEVEFFEAKAPEFPSVDYDKTVRVDDYVTLGTLIDSLQGNVTADGLQNLLIEINRLRSSSISNHTAKIFLQLLSTICQHAEGTLADSEEVSLSLMEEVFSGLKANSSLDVSADQVQKHLLLCTSQVLLLQQKEDSNRVQSALSEEQHEIAAIAEDVNSTDDDLQNEQGVSEESSGSAEKLKSFVQEELADIRKLFLEEITMLRKEFVDK
jgi:pilus assembly protein FimV